MNQAISEIKRVFTTRLDTLDHILGIGDKHFAGAGAFMDKRLADDMLPFAAQIVFACNQPRGFSQWCEGKEQGGQSTFFRTAVPSKKVF